MKECQVEVSTRKVELTFSNGSRLSGEMFLQLHSAHLTGPQRLDEILNGEETFLPLRTATWVELINLDQVVSITTEVQDELDPLLVLGAEHRLKIETLNGEILPLYTFINLPETTNRTKDFLNQKKRFLLFLREGEIVYLARNRIIRVMD